VAVAAWYSFLVLDSFLLQLFRSHFVAVAAWCSFLVLDSFYCSCFAATPWLLRPDFLYLSKENRVATALEESVRKKGKKG